MPAGPLLCWDVFMEDYRRRIAFAKDIQQIKKMASGKHWNMLWDIESILLQQGKVIIITNPLLRIEIASSNMLQMNGYSPEEVVGKSPRLFQGAATEPAAKLQIKTAVNDRKSFDINITNYRKNGSEYKCHIEGHPVFNKQMELVNFIAFENAF